MQNKMSLLKNNVFLLLSKASFQLNRTLQIFDNFQKGVGKTNINNKVAIILAKMKPFFNLLYQYWLHNQEVQSTRNSLRTQIERLLGRGKLSDCSTCLVFWVFEQVKVIETISSSPVLSYYSPMSKKKSKERKPIRSQVLKIFAC